MKKVRLTESELISVIKRIISEQSEHVKNLYKSWANKKSGNPEKALALIDDVFKYQKQLSKKDFAQYSSYEELKKDIDKIKQEAKSTDTTKFYEDNDLLVIAANTWEASCKYGAGSKWCTTARDTDSYWERHNQTGTEFFWIFKNKPQDDPNHKFSYHIKIDGRADWCNAVNNCMGDERLPQNSYPKQHPKYNEIVTKLQEFHNNRSLESKTQKEANLAQSRTILMVFIESLLENEIMNIIDRNYLIDIINKEFDEILDYYISYGIEDSLYAYADRDLYDDLYDDDFKDLKSQLYNNIMRTKNDLINRELTNIYDAILSGLSWVITRYLITNHGINNREMFDQQMEEQNLTITNLVNIIRNDTPAEIEELIKEELNNVFIPIFENEIINLIHE